jgi:hypothetical protein
LLQQAIFLFERQKTHELALAVKQKPTNRKFVGFLLRAQPNVLSIIAVKLFWENIELTQIRRVYFDG